jgi:hypothetical protein
VYLNLEFDQSSNIGNSFNWAEPFGQRPKKAKAPSTRIRYHPPFGRSPSMIAPTAWRRCQFQSPPVTTAPHGRAASSLPRRLVGRSSTTVLPSPSRACRRSHLLCLLLCQPCSPPCRSSIPSCQSSSMATTRARPPSHAAPPFLSEAVGPRAPTSSAPTCILSIKKLTIAGNRLNPSGLGDTAASIHDRHYPSPA